MARLTNQELQEQLEQLASANESLVREAEAQRAAADEARIAAEQARADAEAERVRAAEEIEAARAQALQEARAQVAAAAAASVHAESDATSVATRKKRGWGWTLLATVLVVIASLLAPVSVVSTWAQRELTDTDYFVSTFAPLAKKPAVQNLVITQSVSAIESNVDIEGITSDVFSGIDGLGLPPRASSALNALQAPLVAGIKGLITSTVTKFVQSDAFADIWKQALTTTHTQLLATLHGDKNAAVTIGPGGQIGLQLAPIIEAVKKQLVHQGLTFASSIPVISKTIVIAQSNSISLYIGLYNLVVAIGIWLPWVVLVLLAAGVLVARRRGIALIWASFALGLSMVLVSVGIAVGKTIFLISVSDVMSSDAAGTIYSGILQFVQSIAVAVAVLAFTVFVIAVLSGPFRWAVALRSYATAGFAAARRGAERHGVTTGRVGDWIYRQRVLLRVIVGLIAAAIVVFGRPLTPPLIVWTAVVAVLIVAALELVARPPAEENTTPPAAAPLGVA